MLTVYGILPQKQGVDFMERIKNIYCWNHLTQWIEAQNKGIVHIKEAGGMEDGIFGWEQLLDMIYQNCFPQSLLCFRRDSENYLILTGEQAKLFKFLKSEITLQRKDGTKCLFSDFPNDFRQKVLNAQIDSIWIKVQNDISSGEYLL